MTNERTHASRRRFKEGQLRPVLRPLAAAVSVLLILVGGVFIIVAQFDRMLGVGETDLAVLLIGWSLVAVGIVLFLSAVLSGFLERRNREHAREERARELGQGPRPGGR